ncbi:MAG: TIGR02186 family protein [Parvularculaceae bacterium]
MIRIALMLFALMSFARASAAEIEIALTDDHVAVDTGFAGARLTLFGAVTGVDDLSSIDIVAVISGPDSRFKVRRMEKKNIIWAPGSAHYVENAPGLYLTYSTRPIDDVAPLPIQSSRRLRSGYLDIAVTGRHGAETPPGVAALFRNAFFASAEANGLYQTRVGGVSFRKGALFTIDARLPANTPVGAYDVAVYLFRNGELLSADTAKLAVNRVGLERRIFEFAHRQSVVYGFFCVLLSLVAGWAAAFAFRK